MFGRICRLDYQIFDDRVRLIVPLAFFVLHDAALEVEDFLADGAVEVAHAIRFGKERIVERGGRDVFEIIGPIFAGGAVQVGRADALHGVDEASRQMLAASEHQVFE